MNEAFTLELQKIAMAKKKLNPMTWNPREWGVVKDLLTIGRRTKSGRKGLKEGWDAFAPTIDEKAIANKGSGPVSRVFRDIFGQGEHLLGDTGATGYRGFAEQASRSGWTGTSKALKYAPVGAKSQMVVGTAMAVPSIAAAARGQSDQGLGEAIGENLGFAAGGVLTGGTGLLASAPATIGAAEVGKYVGKRIDRLAGRKPGRKSRRVRGK